MAELNIAAGAGRHKGITRSKKLSTRVDLTPMVDLGFLLIAFFVFTTTLTEPSVMRLVLPADANDGTKVAESTALTVIPMADGKIFYYHGDLQKAELDNLYGTTHFSKVRDLITLQQHTLDQSGRFKRSDLMLIIRPMNDASYKSVVDVLDEVTINQVKHYSLVDITDAELQFVQRHVK